MPNGPWVERSFDAPNVGFRCDCGWKGTDADVGDWAVQFDRNRVVRTCPRCEEPVSEWGAIPTIDGAAAVARGSLRTALADAGVLDE